MKKMNSMKVTSPQAIANSSVCHRKIVELKPDPQNARIHKPEQIRLLAKSIQAFGFNVPVLIDGNDKVLAGHGRLLACQKLGITEVPTISLAHLSAEQAKAFMIADNRLTEIADWNDQLLGQQLQNLSELNLDFDLEATGFTVGEIDLRIEGLDTVETEDDDNFSLAEGPAVTAVDDCWQLAKHRIYCGSALDANHMRLLMNGQLAAMAITDPPFNVKIDGNVCGKGKIKHREFAMATGEMSVDEFTQFLQTSMKHLVEHSIDGSVHMLFIDWRHLPEMLAAGSAVYSKLLNLCVWVKNQAGMGSFYRSQHELVLVYKNGKASHQNNIQLGRFGRHRSNVWEYPGIQSMRHGEEGDLLALHPTVKPITMIADAILDCSKRGDIILDAFLGSGTTLLAAERIGRYCYAMELDPLYVDTAIRRWQRLTGLDAIHTTTGESFTQREALLDNTSTAKETAHV